MQADVSFGHAYKINAAQDERRSETLCYSETEEFGLEYTRGKGWYGSNGYCSGKIETITISVPGRGTMTFPRNAEINVLTEDNYKDIILKEKRDKVLAKLTEEDKKILGLI